jgi:hypothetical protein
MCVCGMYVCMYVCGMYVCMCVCVCVKQHTCVHAYTIFMCNHIHLQGVMPEYVKLRWKDEDKGTFITQPKVCACVCVREREGAVCVCT